MASPAASFFKSLENASFAAYVVNTDWIVVYANRRAIEAFEYFNVKNVVGMSIRVALHSIGLPENSERDIIDSFEHTFATGQSRSRVDFKYKSPNAVSDEYYDWQVHPIELDSGQKGLIAYFSDVTKAVVAEQSVEESKNQFENLAEAMPQMVWTARADGYIDYTNQTTQNYMGVPGERLVGTGYNDFLYPPDLQKALPAWQESLATGSPYEFKFRVKGRDGIYRWFLSRAVPIYANSGELVKWFGTCTDIDDAIKASAELEDKVKARTNELRMLNEEMQRLTAIISHETQEPITTISSYLKLLAVRYRGRFDDDADEFITKCINANAKLGRMIDDLWNYAAASRPDISREEITLQSCVDKVIGEMKGRNVFGATEIATYNLPIVIGNDQLLCTMFEQLIDNSIRYCEGPAKISINTSRQDNQWQITFSDNGIGIDPIHSSEIFHLYKRLNRVEGDTSTGMGLAICRKIIETHEGSIEMVPAKNGTTFLITLPAAI